MRYLAILASILLHVHPHHRPRAPWPSWWFAQAMCIHRHESVDWHRAGTDYLGRPSPYYGGMQFLISTWRNAGGRGLPSDWPPREQLYRAFVVWKRDGGSFREWGTAGVCGLR